MLYKGKELDEFQIEAIKCIEKNENVIVSAPTGTGKTLIADYSIEKCINEEKRVIYTAPIKALSNQKYREFSNLLGAEKVGVLTGDTVINKHAPFLIMTTEIYRNILHSDKELAAEIACVIFDEIHYISDEDRGTVWEESILMKPKETFLIGLSATIPNIGELANWIETVKQEKVNVVYHKERAVPLSHNIYCSGELLPIEKHEKLVIYAEKNNDERDYLKLLDSFNPSDFPILYFSFNRKVCFEKAIEYGRDKKSRDSSTKKKIDTIVSRTLTQYERESDSIGNFNTYMNLFYKGIGVHHAGVLPILKLMVEELFENRLLDIIFCTETFAIGINFPVKTVCIDGYRKFDGHDFRNLFNKEYFQIGGRAGRRGIDEYGTVITMVRPSDIRFADYPVWNEDHIELLQSNFKISYNAAIQMFLNKDENVERMLKDNFALYLLNRQKDLFRESKDNFFKDISFFKNECCDELGKNICPVHHEKVAFKMEESLNAVKSKGDRTKNIKEMKAFRTKKTKNCTREQKRFCRSKYVDYDNIVASYLAEKNLYESHCLRYPEDYFERQYEDKKRLLEKLGYLDLSKNEALIRGNTMKNIYIQELLLCELIYSDFFDKYSEDVICGIVSGIDFDGIKIAQKGSIKEAMAEAYVDVVDLANKLSDIEIEIMGYTDVLFDVTPCNIVYKIANGEKIVDIIDEINISDGDIVSIARRTLAILSEIKEAVSDRPYLLDKIKKCISRIDRDEYKALL